MFDNVEDAFKDLDKKEYDFFAKALGLFRDALVKEGFEREEAMVLVASYSKFVYDMGLEEFISSKDEERYGRETEVDSDDEDELP